MLLLLSLMQLAYVALLAPLFAGILSTVEEKLESKAGPSIFQRYFDLLKLFRKESVVPTVASPFFRIAPYVTFPMYLFLTLVLPIITAFPLTFGPVVDFIGGGLIFGAAATVKKIAAIDSRSNYAHLGASRASSISALSEPIMVLIFILLGVLSGTNNPYVINNTLQTSSAWYGSLLHWFVVGAFFMVLLVETGQLPIESHTSAEFGLIDQGIPIEYSGTELALFQWGGYVKQFLLMSVFLNVFSVPFWVPMKLSFPMIGLYLSIHFVKMLLLTLIFALLNETVSKYRLYKNFDFITMTFAFALLAGLAFYLTGGGI
ncbi:MAG TPA: NADH-quinone oxidoreductase subunit H [Spirochaetia bacterium]|nr:NADH-quinone oxidoreductase subunit H [Spirochaetia bacterium]